MENTILKLAVKGDLKEMQEYLSNSDKDNLIKELNRREQGMLYTPLALAVSCDNIEIVTLFTVLPNFRTASWLISDRELTINKKKPQSFFLLIVG